MKRSGWGRIINIGRRRHPGARVQCLRRRQGGQTVDSSMARELLWDREHDLTRMDPCRAARQGASEWKDA